MMIRKRQNSKSDPINRPNGHTLKLALFVLVPLLIVVAVTVLAVRLSSVGGKWRQRTRRPGFLLSRRSQHKRKNYSCDSEDSNSQEKEVSQQIADAKTCTKV